MVITLEALIFLCRRFIYGHRSRYIRGGRHNQDQESPTRSRSPSPMPKRRQRRGGRSRSRSRSPRRKWEREGNTKSSHVTNLTFNPNRLLYFRSVYFLSHYFQKLISCTFKIEVLQSCKWGKYDNHLDHIVDDITSCFSNALCTWDWG